jgi:UDP-2-acetamido-3-amino-2,3-dideoxy-glucuronate N-acetyltransferase
LKHYKFKDSRGHLEKFVVDLDFIPKEIFFIKEVPRGTVRGKHAHIKCKQLIVLVSGALKITIDDGSQKLSKILTDPGSSILIKELNWASQEFLEENTEIMVICSELYLERDYLREYAIFLNFKNRSRNLSNLES